MKKLILGVDAGSFMVKVAGPYGQDSFKSNISNVVEQKVEERFGDDDMTFNINGQTGMAGSLAAAENPFGTTSIFGSSKAHVDTKIRVLLAVHRYISKYGLDAESVSVVTGQPILGLNEDEKNNIVNMLRGSHEVTVNDDKRNIIISEVGVAPEGSAAFWSTPQDLEGVVRILDCGSGTINAATMDSQRHINSSSDTFNFGMETVKGRSLAEIAHEINRASSGLRWLTTDKVLVCGGSGGVITPYIKEHYKNAEVLMPTLQVGKKTIVLEPTYANAVGFYQIAKGAF